ncbi:MAG: PDC sensor domain-containing protein [Desulfarculaceae bacterium]|nr:PDC sensor domain-containing protein [Desulfarculaceae bacterium]
MSERPRHRAWAFFALVTILAALPLALGYYWLSNELRGEALRQHLRQVNNRLNLWQEQFYDAKWDSQADAGDDTLHLGSYDEARLMADTLVWYVYPDGHAFIEGVAVVGLDGRPRPSKAAAVIDDAGEPLPKARLDELKQTRPWLDDPWLLSYSFVIDAFQKDPERDFYISRLIPDRGRLVYVMAAPWKDKDGKLLGAVVQQQDIKQFARDIILPGAKGTSLWIVDAGGTVGVATDALAQSSAETFAASGALAAALNQGKIAVDAGKMGAQGSQMQALPQGEAQLNWRTMEGSFVLAVVESQAVLGAVGQDTLNKFGAIALLSMVILAAAGAVYTFSALRREGRMVEKATLLRYAGTVSHRVRNALVVLSGAVEMLQVKVSWGKDQQARVDNYDRAVQDIEVTVRELERLSQGDTELLHEGQLGNRSMYRIDPQKDEGGTS